MKNGTDKFSNFGLASMAGYYLQKGKIEEAKHYLNRLIDRLDKEFDEIF